MSALDRILTDQDRRDLHRQELNGIRVNHLGSSDHTVGDVFAALRKHSRIPIRTGHVGNWEEIWQGRVGLVDYNRYLCRDLALGRPVLHAHTFTETSDLRSPCIVTWSDG